MSNKYQTIYIKLMAKGMERKEGRARHKQFYDAHHIIPRSMNGNDDADNLVLLTRKEHYLAHLLLTRIVKNTNLSKAYLALNAMMNGSTKLYHKRYAKTRMGVRIRTGVRLTISMSLTGKRKSFEHKRRISETMTGQPGTWRGLNLSASHKENISKSMKKKGIKRSAATKALLSAAALKREATKRKAKEDGKIIRV